MSKFLHIARACTPMGMELPNARFFKPTPSFLRLMTEFKGLTVYDVGAGVGHVSLALAQSGHTVQAIDIGVRDGQVFPADIANGASIAYAPGAVVMFCRPSHGAYFVGPCIENAVECEAAAIIYVGFERNRHDMAPFEKKFQREPDVVGEDEESMWVWRRDPARNKRRSPGITIAGESRK